MRKSTKLMIGVVVLVLVALYFTRVHEHFASSPPASAATSSAVTNITSAIQSVQPSDKETKSVPAPAPKKK